MIEELYKYFFELRQLYGEGLDLEEVDNYEGF